MGEVIEEKIMEAFYDGCTYKEIQHRCGSPSKRYIQKVIKTNAPEAYEMVSDTKKFNEFRDKQFGLYLDKQFKE